MKGISSERHRRAPIIPSLNTLNNYTILITRQNRLQIRTIPRKTCTPLQLEPQPRRNADVVVPVGAPRRLPALPRRARAAPRARAPNLSSRLWYASDPMDTGDTLASVLLQLAKLCRRICFCLGPRATRAAITHITIFIQSHKFTTKYVRRGDS